MRPSSLATRNRTLIRAAVIAGLGLCLSGCGSRENLPPVFGAVFGVPGVQQAPYSVGKIGDPVVQPGDRVIGTAANAPGQCIYFSGTSDRRFRADCPEGYRP
ncbi:hypothetical protein [Mangrovicella endophytica]|uniref:hypothetical protein n=1 Tax=Mangrovicella endophytica TaxID=2066697 RepID=UPI0012FFF0A8|nr:hypothetical protein [Mangrovicella endophytica]